MNQTTYDLLQTERATNAARNEAIDAQIAADPLESGRYRVQLGPPVDSSGNVGQEPARINGVTIQNANANSAVNPDATFSQGWFVLNSPVSEPPPNVVVIFEGVESSYAWEAIPA